MKFDAMINDFYPIVVLLTIFGTIGLLRLQGISENQLFEAESRHWQLVRGVAVGSVAVAATLHLFYDPRWHGESLMSWAFIPLGFLLWARCITLLRDRGRATR